MLDVICPTMVPSSSKGAYHLPKLADQIGHFMDDVNHLEVTGLYVSPWNFFKTTHFAISQPHPQDLLYIEMAISTEKNAAIWISLPEIPGDEVGNFEKFVDPDLQNGAVHTASLFLPANSDQ